jgi:hypothetical protein
MPEQDKDSLDEGQPNEFMPGGEDFEERGEETEAEREEREEFEASEAEREERDELEGPKEPGRFGRLFRRGPAEPAEQPLGSVRESHERVRVDDRLSAIFAIVCALGLVGILAGGFLGQYVPSPAAPPLNTLGLETFNAPSLTPSPSVSASPSASASASPTASPSASPTASPTASPS